MTEFKYLRIELKHHYALVTLDRGRANPINLDMLDELHICFNEITDDPEVKGVILTGKEDYFSVGVDVMEVFDYDHDMTEKFWSSLIQIMVKLAKFPKPLIAAISGHAPAGGCVLAIPADYRLMVAGDYTIGLNEIPLGIIVPENFFHMYAFWIEKHKAYQYLLEGKLLSVDEALKCGLVDQKCSSDELLFLAEQKLAHYLALIPEVFQTSKLNFRRELIRSMQIDWDRTLATFMDQWWSQPTRTTISKLIQSIKNK